MASEKKSPFEGAWEHMFGWGYEKRKQKLLDIVIYDTRPEVLQAIYFMTLDLWKIVSDYTGITGPVTFEIWRYVDLHDPSKLDTTINANWYGPLTYGTCWFRGCKIWLTPVAGIMMNVLARETGRENGPGAQARAFWMTNKRAHYDTHFTPYRTGTPKEFIEEIRAKYPRVDFSKAGKTQLEYKNTTEVHTPGNWHNVLTDGDDTERMNARERAAWVLWCLRGKEDRFVHFDEIQHREGNAGEGGDPDVLMIRDPDALFRELAWIQASGEENHNVRFLWL